MKAVTFLDGAASTWRFDLRMEPSAGSKLMEAAHQRQPRLPVLIMTAHGTIDNAVEAVARRIRLPDEAPCA